MSEDIRLCVNFLGHRKTRRLKRRLGAEGVLSLITLWLSAAAQRPNGFLTDFNEDDIEDCADWTGTPGEFVQTLLDAGFLDSIDGIYHLHNWDARQGWVIGTDDRKDKARFSRMASIYPAAFRQLQDAGVTSITQDDYADLKKQLPNKKSILTDVQRFVNERSNASLTPAPAPAPAPNEENKKEKKKKTPPPKAVPKTPPTEENKIPQTQELKNRLAKFLNTAITDSGLSDHREDIEGFFNWRMSLPKNNRYKSEEGIKGLIRELLSCKSQGWKIEECIRETLDREWLAPKVEYLKNTINFGRSSPPRIKGGSLHDRNKEAGEQFVAAMLDGQEEREPDAIELTQTGSVYE